MCLSSNKGFTLVEVLVVLVIVSLSSVLLIQSFNLTWGNLSRLNHKNLAQNSTKLGLLWFQQSIHKAHTFHPEDVVFEGNNNQLFLFSSYQLSNQPSFYTYRWSINDRQLILEYVQNGQLKNTHAVAYLGENARFEYLIGQQWQSTFINLPGQLPSAIRIANTSDVLVTASPYRNIYADVPAEMQSSGKYEFK